MNDPQILSTLKKIKQLLVGLLYVLVALTASFICNLFGLTPQRCVSYTFVAIILLTVVLLPNSHAQK